MQSHYEQLASINVNDHVEKKNGLSSLSWTWALDQLLRLDPEASWSYAEPKLYADTLMVFCTVRAFGRERTAHLPVMDHKHRAIPNPDAFQVNTAMQRALAKGCALHGLGMYIYGGEDLPAEADKADKAEKSPRAAASPKRLSAPAGIEAPATDTTVTASPDVSPAIPSTMLSVTQIAKVKALLAETGTSLQRLLAFFRVESLEKIPASDYPRVIQTLESAKRRAA